MEELKLAREILDYLSPFLVHAGRYARGVQSRIERQPPKNQYADSFSAALTDADLSVQGFIEVALLAHFPQVAFFGEEAATSLNAKYFPSAAPLTVYLDPIDGTRFFQDNLPNFNVIASVADKQRLLAAACYIPVCDKFFRALRGSGSTIQSGEEVLLGAPGRRVDLSQNPPVAVTHDQREAVSRLTADFKIVALADDYRPDRTCLSINSVLLGESSVIIGGEKVGVIDWGALAFLAEEAGAAVSDWEGRPLPGLDRLPDPYFSQMLICRDKAVQARVIAALRGLRPSSR